MQIGAETVLEITRESLQQRYSDLADAELLRRVRSGALTELAREIALAELAERGISLDAVVEPPPAPHATIEFAADEFERNPYQAPRIAVDAVREARARPEASVSRWLWWIYAACVSGSIAFAAYYRLRHTLDAAALIGLLINVWAMLGLIGWRLRRGWLHANVWVTALAVSAAQLCLLIKYLADATFNEAYAPTPGAMIAATASVALNLPLLWALLSYAFLSPSLWQRPARRQTSP